MLVGICRVIRIQGPVQYRDTLAGSISSFHGNRSSGDKDKHQQGIQLLASRYGKLPNYRQKVAAFQRH